MSRKPFSEPRTENDLFIFLSGAQQNVFFYFARAPQLNFHFFHQSKDTDAGDENLSFPLPTNSCLATHSPGTAVHTDLCCPSILYVYG